MHNGPPPYGAPSPPPGYGPPPAPPYGYGPPPTQQETWVNPNRIGVTEIVAPILLSVFCVGLGFVWGFYKLIQGHNMPGWVAIAINAGWWALCALFWFAFFAVAATAQR